MRKNKQNYKQKLFFTLMMIFLFSGCDDDRAITVVRPLDRPEITTEFFLKECGACRKAGFHCEDLFDVHTYARVGIRCVEKK